jgi:polyisoprenoid-binding protein YceI
VARFRIVPERSRLTVEARSSVHPITIETQSLEGHLEVDVGASAIDLKRAPSGSLKLAADGLVSGIELYDLEIQRMIEVRKYRHLRGEVKDVKDLGGSRYRVKGDIQFHGVTQSIEGDVAVRVVDAETLEIEGERVFDMRDFQLDPPKIMMLRVFPEVTVRGKLIAVRG